MGRKRETGRERERERERESERLSICNFTLREIAATLKNLYSAEDI